MSRFLKVDAGEHGIILVEITSALSDREGLVQVGAEEVIIEAKETFDNLLDVTRKCALEFFEEVQNIEKSTRLDEASLEFGINLGADVGAVIARASSEGNFKVVLKWKMGKGGHQNQD
jgi:hypothetical protein